MKARVPIIDFNQCKQLFESKGIVLSNSQLCAGGKRKDACRGDSGGPIMAEDTSNPLNTKWYAIGIVSFGYKVCGKENIPSVYTNVKPYIDWINKIMKS